MIGNRRDDNDEPLSFNVLGIEISIVTTIKVLDCLLAWKDDKFGRYICVRDVPSLMLSVKNNKIKEIYRLADMVVPDGMPLVWIGKGLGHNLERVCGPDLMYEVCVIHDGMGFKHFFYGGKPGVADRLKSELQRKAPKLEVVGTFCPPFRNLTDDEDVKIIKMIRDSGADILWIGISSPKQDTWMAKHKPVLSQTMIGVGAAFDFLSGQVPRAPLWMQRRGLEWTFRLLIEPKRLWRRYLILVPRFIVAIIKNGLFYVMLKGVMKK